MSDEDKNSNQTESADDQLQAEDSTVNQNETAAGEDNARPAPMDEFTPSAQSSGGAPDLDVIMDIPVQISMAVGSTDITIRNLLQLNQGSVIELDRLAGEPLDVFVNGTLIAHGEVVVVNEKFGIRMTDVISPSERINRLTRLRLSRSPSLEIAL